MNIPARLRELDARIESSRLAAPAVSLSIGLLYVAVLVPAFESKPLMAVCVTLVIAGFVPLLLRWHAWRVERRVLAGLARRDDPPTSA